MERARLLGWRVEEAKRERTAEAEQLAAAETRQRGAARRPFFKEAGCGLDRGLDA